MELINISKVQTGLVLIRKKVGVTDKQTYEYNLLTLKCFEPQGFLNEQKLDSFLSKEKLENKYLTKKGDVIIRLTSPYTAICINKKQEGLVIPSNFIIIRLCEKRFIPEYVALFLNSEMIEKKFLKLSISVTIPLIKTIHLKNIDIIEKSLDIQKNIVELNKLYMREKMLMINLMKEKENLEKIRINKIILEE